MLNFWAQFIHENIDKFQSKLCYFANETKIYLLFPFIYSVWIASLDKGVITIFLGEAKPMVEHNLLPVIEIGLTMDVSIERSMG